MVNKFPPRKSVKIGIDKLVEDIYEKYPLTINKLKEYEMRKLTYTEIEYVTKAMAKLTNLNSLASSNFPRSTEIEFKTSGTNPFVSLSIGNGTFKLILELAQREIDRQEKESEESTAKKNTARNEK